MKRLKKKKQKRSSFSEKLVPSLRDSIFNSSSKDLAMDIGEMGIDVALEEGVLEEVPIVKTAVALCKTGMAIRERNFLKQTLLFIQSFNVGELSEKEKTKYREKSEENPEFAEDELGRVMLLLESNIENIKSVTLGRLYYAYVKGAITWEKFCEYSEANARMFASDYALLNKLFSGILDWSKQDRYKIGRLIALGMVVEKDSPAAESSYLDNYMRKHMTTVQDGFYGMMPQNSYQMTSFGKGFMHIIHEKRE